MDDLDFWHRIERRLDTSCPAWRARVDSFGQIAAGERRRAGGAWSDNDVLEALVLAVLSANVDWAKVEAIRSGLDELFQGFDLLAYAALSEDEISTKFLPWFEARKAGSRNLRSNLVNLVGAARRLLQHARAHGTAESYFTGVVQRHSQGDPKRAAILLGHGTEHKLPSLGVPLAAETLRNLGFDVAKPDRHVMRAVGCFGLGDFGAWSADAARRAGWKPPSPSCKHQMTAMAAVDRLAKAVRERVVLVDTAIWQLGAKSGAHLSNADLECLADRSQDGLVALLESWMLEDESEQRETLAHLTRALDQNRHGARRLFPEALKGKTW